MKPRPALGESRAMLSLEAILAHRTKMLTNAASAYLLNRLGLYNNLNLLDGLPKIDGFLALELREERELRFTLYPGANAYRIPLANFLSVSQVNSETNIFVWTTRSNYLPMATAGQKPIFLDPHNTLAALDNPGFDPSHVVYLFPEDQAQVSVTNQTSAQIISSNWTAHRVELEVQAPERSLVVIGQSFHHNWQAAVDNKRTKLFQANYAFQAFEVPSGLHHVTLAYRDRAFQAGLVVSVATLVFVAVLAGLPRRKIF
jgi:hypothetical protein